MNRTRLLLLTLTIFALLLLVSCDQDDDDKDDDAPEPEGDDDDQAESGYIYDFTFEYRDQGTLRFWEVGERLVGALAVQTGNDLLPGGFPIEGEGRFLDFTESGYRMLQMNFTGLPTYTACGEGAVYYSLVLTFREPNGFLIGGLSAFCDPERFGRPARLMRLSGLLQSVARPGE